MAGLGVPAKGTNIHDFGQGLWWSIETVTTVGYGDRYPTTPFGQGVAVYRRGLDEQLGLGVTPKCLLETWCRPCG